MPLKSQSTAIVWSNLLLHWLDDPLPALAEAHRVLEVGGLLMFSTLGPDSLKELRSAFSDGYAHTQRFIDMHDLGDMLVGCGFADPVMDMEVLTLTYDGFDEMLGELRAAGSGCAMKARRHGLTGRQAWARRALPTRACAAMASFRRRSRSSMAMPGRWRRNRLPTVAPSSASMPRRNPLGGCAAPEIAASPASA